MNSLAFASRNCKEFVRDPLSIIFGIGFPVVLILLISMMNRSIQGMAQIFSIDKFAPGMAVFGLSFLSLFLGMLIARDRDSAFLMRLFASPLTGSGYIIGYSLPLLPVAIVQCIFCFLTAFFFGLPLSFRLIVALVVLIPVGVLFIGFGLLMGSLFTYNQVGGFSSILVNVAAWLSGTWFPLDLIGGTFKTICNLLPFAHAVSAVQAAVAGDYAWVFPHLLWVIGYALLLFIAAVFVFQKKMKG